MKLYLQIPATESEKDALKTTLASDELWFANPEKPDEADRKAFLGAEVAFGYCPPAWVAESMNLRWLQLLGVGFDGYLSLDWKTLGQRIHWTNMRGVFSTSVAETCVAGILAFTRGIKRSVELRPRHAWEKNSLRANIRSLSGARVLILGTGTIAQRTRALLQPFDCDITMYGQRAEAANITGLDALEAALPKADVVIALLPETAKTQNLLSAERLGLFPPQCLFVNAGRGSVVDELALIDALTSGRIAGAVLDVTRTEPLPEDHPLWECGNVILTQHSAGGSNDEIARAIRFFLENLEHYRAGQPLQNTVDWRRGY